MHFWRFGSQFGHVCGVALASLCTFAQVAAARCRLMYLAVILRKVTPHRIETVDSLIPLNVLIRARLGNAENEKIRHSCNTVNSAEMYRIEVAVNPWTYLGGH
jgi:hypothetical protein